MKMSFESKGKRPDFSVKARHKDTGENISIGAAWEDERFTHPYLRFDRDIDFIVLVMNDGRKVKVTTGKDGTHNVRLYVNGREEKVRTFRSEEAAFAAPSVDDFDFSDL